MSTNVPVVRRIPNPIPVTYKRRRINHSSMGSIHPIQTLSWKTNTGYHHQLPIHIPMGEDPDRDDPLPIGWNPFIMYFDAFGLLDDDLPLLDEEDD